MPTYYIDFDGGNDANTGLSFAQRWKTITNGATAARIAPGDEIRIMASPAPTSIGNALWTGGGRPASVPISSSTNATPIVINTGASPHGLVTGDYVVVTNHTTNTNANGVWRVGTTPSAFTFQILQIDGTNTTGNGAGIGGNATKANNLVVKTASALVQNIALCGGLGQKPAWTASANVTATQNLTLFKEGVSGAQIAIAAAFTTGKAAYYTLPSTLDLSSYQQVAFWVQQASGTLGTAGQTYLALCTDTLGDTVAHTCNIPALGALGAWSPVVFDNSILNPGSPGLNSAIRSVALYVVTDVGAQTFILDNIVACKASSSADSVTLQSLVSKSDGTGDEAWYAIQSINSDVIMLANANTNTSLTTNLRGYNGTTQTVTTYKRETTKTDVVALSTSVVAAVNDDGTSGNLITYSGGWNRTDMSTQTGQTWYDGRSGVGVGFQINGRAFIQVDRLSFCRYTTGFQFAGSTNNITVGSIYVTACASGVDLPAASYNCLFSNVWANNIGPSGSAIAIGGFGHLFSIVKTIENSSAAGATFSGSRFCTIGSVVAGNQDASNIDASIVFSSANNNVIGTATITNNAAGSAVRSSTSFSNYVNGGSSSGCSQTVSNSLSEVYFNSFTMNEALEISTLSGGYIYSNRHDNTDNNSWVFQPGVGNVNQQTAVVDSPATTAWQMRPTASTASGRAPLVLKLGTVVCAASSEVTVRARMRRTNTALTMRLICPGGQISGVTNDVFSDMTAAANTWQTVEIKFTPTKAGGVDIYAYAFGGTTFSGYVTNLTASQV